VKHIFWLLPDRVAGRAGPNREPWDPALLAGAGIDVVLSVNFAQAVDVEALQAAGLRHACLPLPEDAPPSERDELHCAMVLPRALEYLEAELDAGATVLIHCSSGKDRTGMLMVALLMRREGLAVEAALAAVRAVRPIALSAEGWEPMARRVLARL